MNPFEIEMAFEYNDPQKYQVFLKPCRLQSWTRTTANNGNIARFSPPTALQ